MILDPVLSIAAPGESDLTVVMEKIKNNKGKIVIALCSSPEQYYSDENIFKTARVDPIKPVTQFVFKDIPYGEYALKIYHDKNNNDKLDTGLFGIPGEGYGFSNDPAIRGSMPSFEDTVFKIRAPGETKKVKMR